MIRPPLLRLLALAIGLAPMVLLLGVALWRPRLPEPQAGVGVTATARHEASRTPRAHSTETASPTLVPEQEVTPTLSPTPEPAAPTLVPTASATPEPALPSATDEPPTPLPSATDEPPTPLPSATDEPPTPLPSATPVPPTATTPARALGLRDHAGDFLIGFSTRNDFWDLPDAEIYQTIAAGEFNILTPASQMKWAVIHPARNTYRFAEADRHVEFAERHGMRVHGHTLVWHSTNPRWLTERDWSKQELQSILVEHIDNVVGHYRGRVTLWDVVNEAFTTSGKYRKTLWWRGMGKGYVELAFERARAADPAAKLLYNDFDIEEINAKSDAVYEMVADFKRRGVPIDGIGFQLHTTVDGINLKSFAKNMRRFANLGLEIYITEADVRLKDGHTEDDLQAQARTYRGLLRTCLEQPACKGFQLWGFTDKYSWIPASVPGYGTALIFDKSYLPKPAYYAIREEFKKGRS